MYLKALGIHRKQHSDLCWVKLSAGMEITIRRRL